MYAIKVRETRDQLWQRAQALKARYERYFPISFFLLGFIYDSLTLTRIDRMFDNIVLLFYIVLAGILITVIGRLQTGQLRNKLILKYAKWYPNILQFLFGGLFSAYVIFYFKSAAVDKSLIFVVLLAGLFLANEFMHEKLENLILLCTMYFFACFAFFTFFIPVVTKSLDAAVFLTSGTIGFVLTALLITAIYFNIYRKSPKKFFLPVSPSLGVFGIMALLYLTNAIPPVPLSMKDAGIYHHVHKQGESYQVKHFRPSAFHFWVDSDEYFRYSGGDTVFCFASVFAPFALKTRVYHHWQYKDPRRGEYRTTDRLSYAISGGRDGGYRGYTYKRNVRPGEWRVDIETENGQVLGRIHFLVVDAGSRYKGLEVIGLK